MIQLQNISKHYKENKKDVQVLNNINLHVQKGDIYAVIGVSGAGKSTLMRLMGLLEEPSEGKILLNGVDTIAIQKKEKLKQLRKVGTIFQGYHLLMQKTVFDNVAFPLTLNKTSKDEITKKVEHLLNLVGLQDKKEYYPSKLSGGQKQRVAIARALATNPEILLCDEPTSALDSLTTHSILKLLKQINQQLGLTIIIVTHDMEVVEKICNKVAVIDNGSVIDNGTIAQVLENKSHPTTKALFETIAI